MPKDDRLDPLRQDFEAVAAKVRDLEGLQQSVERLQQNLTDTQEASYKLTVRVVTLETAITRLAGGADIVHDTRRKIDAPIVAVDMARVPDVTAVQKVPDGTVLHRAPAAADTFYQKVDDPEDLRSRLRDALQERDGARKVAETQKRVADARADEAVELRRELDGLKEENKELRMELEGERLRLAGTGAE